MGAEQNEIFLPFIQLDLEGTSIGKHIVISSHASQDSIHRAYSECQSANRTANEAILSDLALAAGTNIPS